MFLGSSLTMSLRSVQHRRVCVCQQRNTDTQIKEMTNKLNRELDDSAYVGESPRIGRPPLPPGQAKEVRASLRTTPARLAKADQFAAKLGLSRNAWIERLIDLAKS